MKINLPPGVNTDKKNIFNISIPYYLLQQFGDDLQKKQQSKDLVMFWGVTFKNLPSIYSGEEEIIKKTNLCLDYIRKQYPGYKLVYKAHPHETDEASLLDLRGFNVLKEKTVAEFVIMKNYDRIKHIFSTASSASMTAHKMGIDAHIFLPVIESAYTIEKRKGLWRYFEGMPKEFFISDLKNEVKASRAHISNQLDSVFSEKFLDVLSKYAGTAWFIVGDPGLLPNIIVLARAIKKISLQHKVGLIIEKHHRWDVMDIKEVGDYFDCLLEYPRWFYSLKPARIYGRIRTALNIKKAPIKPGDIIIGFNFTSFTENCFLSYFKNNFKIAFIKKEVLEFNYGPKEDSFFKKYFTRKGVTFNSKIIEPLLGLNRVIFYEDPVRVSNFDRYLKPINDIYDQVYVH
ncbi:MAG: hypothetical protein COV29_02185 [Candidatus Yanofskybacteria bacterium CG10_big_fil_rev_8_21_14_0_10_36_16]|uniref:Uncharacterized protein n=1 Tax=Candidatus Yanofskybacteria bacterium CG10_big_fil_rev_8_21_14_0_10_36_16 TaxID=1975096 RepID=A0A2J0Q7K2_9BACT|nr:MAG: hypothetical protein COV29_02185 [Candidatus Yanofskybacteria bacterium CG10_big_fil_rev_8_21_14_0_10_36_16]